ncbi:MAG: two-component system, cell cycle sensor histidine kinase and response regulator CckA [Gaiellaceae bacterium]|nr:two-component system, cell cycle sensor histidine kinase and response regulator CckA [Gaiellaceae bacterium]
MHSLLQRQLRRFCTEGLPEEFLEAVDAAYRQFDADRNMLERSMELSSDELLEANGALRGMAAALEVSVADRTAELERATMRLQSELDERRRLEQDLLQAQKMEAVGRLAGGVAHDFNNLLTAILGNGEFLLQEVAGDPKLVPYVNEIQEAGQRAAGLTQQLLAFSRKQRLNPTLLDLNTLVTDLTRMLRRMIAEDVEIVTVAAPALRSVRADAGQIEQAIMNLVVNARDAMPGGGKILIATRNVDVTDATGPDRNDLPVGSYVALSVTDTGGGIPPEVEPHLFEPFFTTKQSGTGLGLATVYGMVKQSGGTISVESTPGEGAVFTLYFPAVALQAAPALEPVRSLGSPGGSEVVLLVEDEGAVRSLARKILERGGYTVLEAGRGSEALTLADGYSDRIDLLVSDMVMPGMSGPDLSSHLGPRRPRMRVLFMSGYSEELATKQGAPQHRATPFLSKPFRPDDMLRAVRHALDGREAA